MSTIACIEPQIQGRPSDRPNSWFAVHTFPRHEKRVSEELTSRGIQHYLPLVARMHQWSDRRKEVALPLFPCYVFVQICPVPEHRLQVLRVKGVIGFVGSGKEGTSIPDSQIEGVRILVTNKILADPYPFLKVGQRVRVRGSYLDGMEGILLRRNGTRRLVISVEALEQSLSVCVDGFQVEAV
jgi:transcription antitermination factor NusG